MPLQQVIDAPLQFCRYSVVYCSTRDRHRGRSHLSGILPVAKLRRTVYGNEELDPERHCVQRGYPRRQRPDHAKKISRFLPHLFRKSATLQPPVMAANSKSGPRKPFPLGPRAGQRLQWTHPHVFRYTV